MIKIALRKIAVVPFLLVLVLGSLQAQQTIQEQFDTFYQNETSTWEEFKLIKKPKLRNFWTIVADTIKIKEQKISIAQNEIIDLKVKLGTITQQLEDTNVSLAASKELNDSIAFMGTQMSKSFYNGLVWLIIIVLIAGAGALYIMFLRSNKITKDARKTLAKVEEEYTEHKDKARDNQAKLKRELQTALNALQEHRIKL